MSVVENKDVVMNASSDPSTASSSNDSVTSIANNTTSTKSVGDGDQQKKKEAVETVSVVEQSSSSKQSNNTTKFSSNNNNKHRNSKQPQQSQPQSETPAAITDETTTVTTPTQPAPQSISEKLALLRTPSISHPKQHVTLTCYIPPSKVGAVIGRGGRSILSIQQKASRKNSGHQSPVRMSVIGGGLGVVGEVSQGQNQVLNQTSESTTDNNKTSDTTDETTSADPYSHLNIISDPFWTPVIIRGDPCGVFAAASLLFGIVEEEMDDVVLDIPILRSKHSAIIGKRGHTIAALSADSNVRIMVPSLAKQQEGRYNHHHPNSNNVETDKKQQEDVTSSDQQDSSSTVPPEAVAARKRRENINNVQLEGKLSDVEYCLVNMLSVVSPNVLPPNQNFSFIFQQKTKGKAGQQPTLVPISDKKTNKKKKSTSPNVEMIITVPSQKTNLVPSLTKLRQIAKKTNTIIRRKRSEKETEQQQQAQEDLPKNKTSVTQLTVSGKQDQVSSAMKTLTKLLQVEENDTFITMVESTSDQKGDDDQDQDETEQQQQQLDNNNTNSNRSGRGGGRGYHNGGGRGFGYGRGGRSGRGGGRGTNRHNSK